MSFGTLICTINTPLIGSWIETLEQGILTKGDFGTINTPLIGSWIETIPLLVIWKILLTINTPLIGSWIETVGRERPKYLKK